MKKLPRHLYDFKDKIVMPFTKSILSITIVLRGKKIVFRDTYTLFSAPLANVMKAYTSFEKTETPIYKKLEDIVIDDYCKQYSKIDTLALSIALKKRQEIGKNAITTASGALKEFKSIINQKQIK